MHRITRLRNVFTFIFKRPFNSSVTFPLYGSYPSHIRRFSAATATFSVAELAQAIQNSETWAVSRAITLAESSRDDHALFTQKLLQHLAEHGNVSRSASSSRALAASPLKSFRCGISGSPGVGKSTFIENFGLFLAARDNKVAVLTVDPSSQVTGGSILGDKSRMDRLATHPNAYIRPSPTRGVLGGLARHTDDVISICEAAKYNIILVETVGVGQSEAVVSDVVDMLILMISPFAGDDLQGSKKGLLELADLILINKADGPTENAARITRGDYERALTLSRKKLKFWTAPVIMTSSASNEVAEPPQQSEQQQRLQDRHQNPVYLPHQVWNFVQEFLKVTGEHGDLQGSRIKQKKKWMWNEIREGIFDKLRNDPHMLVKVKEQESLLEEGTLTSRQGAINVLEYLFREK